MRRICFPFVGDSVGGSHLSATLLIRHLDRSRYLPTVVIHQDGPLARHLGENGLACEVLPLARLAGESPGLAGIGMAQARALPRLVQFLRRGGFDAVHTNDLRCHLTWAPAARFAGRRFIWHQRVLLSRSPAWSALALAADHAICISEAVRASLPTRPRVPATVIANPVVAPALDRNAARAALLAELALPATVRLVGFVGNMTRQKRPQVFVEAAAALVREPSPPDLAFLLFGDDRGGELARMRELAGSLGIGERTRFMGFRSPIEPCIAGLDLLIAPGVGDGFGRTLAEAMTVGTPVVAAASGGHVELIEDGRTGFLAPPDDGAAFATAARRLLQDPALGARIAAAARDYAECSFGAAEHAARVAAVYDLVFGTAATTADAAPAASKSR